MLNLFKLWLATFSLGLFFYPMTACIFRNFKDKGWFFSKILGLCISSWTMWILSYTKLIPYTTLNCYLVIMIFIIIQSLVILRKWKNKQLTFEKDKIHELLKNLLISEVIFIICLCFWFYVKGFSSSINNYTEQFMDYGFMNSIMNSKYMPPQDIWLSGESLNYYYFGQYIFGFLCKISGLTASDGYFLIIALIATYTFVLPFSIGYNLFKANLENDNKLHDKKKCILKKILLYTVAICIGLASSIGGTLHYPIYRWFSSDKENYSYIHETRYIGYEPENTEDTATEVPAYSSVVGDLHAHYIDYIFSLTTLALLMAYFMQESNDCKKNKYLSCLNVFLIAFMFGINKMINYWDYPIFLVIISTVIISKQIICGKFNKKNIISMLIDLAFIIIVEELITLPFSLDLVVNGTKVCFTGRMSPLYKLLIKWGIQTLCVFSFLVIYLIRFKKSEINFKQYLNNHLEDLFVIIIGLCAFGLVLMPEIIYLKDIYGEQYKRFNTMFKLTYQAFSLYSITTSYILFKLALSKNKIIRVVSIIVLVITLTTFGYGIDAIITTSKRSKYNEISATNTESFIKNALPDDYKAIEWIRSNINQNSIIVESTKMGNSYSTSSRISTFTGNPTVVGWIYHEWIWRYNEDYSIPQILVSRNRDIKNLYITENIDEAKYVINKYNIDYIYIGQLEYETYPNINLELLKSLGNIVYNDSDVYLIKVK